VEKADGKEMAGLASPCVGDVDHGDTVCHVTVWPSGTRPRMLRDRALETKFFFHDEPCLAVVI
jgi:hypothetical protein